MPNKITWTDAQNTRLKRMRVEGASWDSIAATFGVTRSAVIEQAKRIGARRPPADFVPEPDDPSREPLPPGHPRTWKLLNSGTVLEDDPYPRPVYIR